MAESKKSSILDAMMKQYDDAKSNKKSYESTTDLTKYFNPRLEDNENSGEVTIRILPPKNEGESPFEIGFFYSLQVNGKWKKLYCSQKNDGVECPIWEVKTLLEKSSDKGDKELASKYEPRIFYLVRVIERNNEDEGVKIWRFPHNYKGEGIYDKILPLFQKKGDITDPRTGRDITLILGRDDKKNTKVTSIIADDVSLLTDVAKKAKTWLSEPITWKDVYKRSPEEYLQIIADGDTPVWSKESKKFIPKSEADEESQVEFRGSQKTATQKTEIAKKVSKFVVNDDNNEDEDEKELVTPNVINDEDDDDDLPF
jgi:hypothetical protein